MHMKTEQLRNLAVCYLDEQPLTDPQVQLKYHMAECDDCYEKFFTELIMLKALSDNGLMEPGLEKRDDKLEEKSFIKIRSVKDKLEVLCTTASRQLEELWNFIYMPLPVYQRGVNENIKELAYISQISEYSCIKKENGLITIQLDGEYYSTAKLAVKYIAGGAPVYKEFAYDEGSECYIVSIEESVLENGVIEIVEISEKQ